MDAETGPSQNSLLKEISIMPNSYKYSSSDISSLMDKIAKNSIGMDEYFNRIFNMHETTANYPPYNLIQISSVESKLEIALSGFKKSEVQVYTECGKLFVEAEKEDKETNTNYLHKGLAQRSFKRSWTLSDDTEVGNVLFEDGLLEITLRKIVPTHHERKNYL